MKKILGSIMLFSLVMLFAACDFNPGDMPMPGNDAKEEQKMPQAAEQTQADASKFIGEEKAKELALKKAGISADGVKFDRVELDRDDGVWQYEVDFRQDNMEYDVDINAENGEILSFDKEREAGF